jgi:hypothetical protein
MKNKENYFGCLTFIACVILGIGWVVSASNKNEEIKLLNTKIGIKDEIIQNLENKEEKKSEAKKNQKPQLPVYVYLDRENCVHSFSECNIIPIKNNNISSSQNYAIKRLKVYETDFSKYEWYCAKCVGDDYYNLLQTKNKKKPSPTATPGDDDIIEFVPEDED